MTQTHAPRRSPAEQARLDGLMTEIFEQKIPFNQILGLRMASLDPGEPKLTFAMRPELVGSYVHGRLHGGMISATLDTAGGLAVMVAIAEKYSHESADQVTHRFGRIGTIDLRVDYLRPGISPRFIATGKVIRLGGRIASVQMTLEDAEGEVVATGSAAYVVS